MTFKLRNPWIDPRVELVRSKDAQLYLVKKGWIYNSRSIQGMLSYDPPNPATAQGGSSTKAIVPEELDEGASMERMIELIATIASYEKRFAGDVLNDLLRINNAPALSVNGISTEASTHAVS